MFTYVLSLRILEHEKRLRLRKENAVQSIKQMFFCK